jgi:hypothetical protein
VAIARKSTSKPLGISKTVRDFRSLTRESEGVRGRPRIVSPARTPRPTRSPSARGSGSDPLSGHIPPSLERFSAQSQLLRR